MGLDSRLRGNDERGLKMTRGLKELSAIGLAMSGFAFLSGPVSRPGSIFSTAFLV